MNKKRRRMESFAENVNKRSREAKLPPAVLTFTEKLLIFGTIGGAILLTAGLQIRSLLPVSREMLEQRVEEWKSTHQLSDSQAAELLEIEIAFHRADGFFAIKRNWSADEIKAHNRAIDAKLGKKISDH